MGWIDWDRYQNLLGTMADRELAKIIGCCLSTVHKKRNSLSIPCFMEKKKSSATWDNSSCKVGFTMPMNIVRMIDDNYKHTKEPRSRYIARLVREDNERKEDNHANP